MALYQSILRYCSNRLLRHCVAASTKAQFCDEFGRKSLHVDVDIIDDFTTQLVQNKSEKWAKRKWKSSHINSNSSSLGVDKNKSIESQLDVRLLSTDDMNTVLKKYIDCEDYNNMILMTRECVKYKKLPEFPVISVILNYCSQRGEKDLIIQLQNLYDELKPSAIEISGKEYFTYFLAGAIWIKGDIKKSLSLYEDIYRKFPHLRRRIKLTIHDLISDAAVNKGEAVLRTIVDFCQNLQDEYSDTYLLCCVWQHCFLSEWFSDQSMAIELLELNETLCDALGGRIPYVIVVSLQNNRLEVVYRLLEYFLKNGRKAESSGLLVSLFDHHLKQKNLQSCSAILHWCRDNDVHLPCINSTEFINLLINQGSSPKVSVKQTQKAVQKYNFKF